MVRIKTTTSNGVEFLSPFAYTKAAGEALIKKLERWYTRPVYELENVEFKNCHPDCLYNQTWDVYDVIGNVSDAERKWQ
jgi:hypothetical protein